MKIKFNHKLQIIGVCVLILIGFLILKKDFLKIMNIESENKKSVLTVCIDETPQIPWNIVDVSTFTIETFAAAVFGSLAEINEAGIKDTSGSNILLENFICVENTCIGKIKPGVFFHNGREVNAYDVEFSLARQLFSYENDNFSGTNLSEIEGVNELIKSKKNVIKNKTFEGIQYPSGYISGIKIIDKYNFEIKLNYVNNYFFQKMSTGFLPIVPIEALQNDYITWKTFPIGFGKYKVIDADIKTSVYTLEKVNPNEDIPDIVRFVFDSHTPVDIRVASEKNKDLKQNQEIVVLSNVYANGGFFFNYKTELGQNKYFRAAVSRALDRKKISQVSAFNELTPEDQMLPNYGWQKIYRAPMEVQTQDIEEAKKLLKNVPDHLWKNKKFTVRTFWTTQTHLSEVSSFIEIKNQLAQIGLDVEFLDTDMTYTRFKTNDENVLWWTGFDMVTDNPTANFSYFRPGSFFNNIYPTDDNEFDYFYERALKYVHTGPDDVKNLSAYFTTHNIMVIACNLRKAFIVDKNKIESLGAQTSGVKLKVWEIKINR